MAHIMQGVLPSLARWNMGLLTCLQVGLVTFPYLRQEAPFVNTASGLLVLKGPGFCC